MQEYGRRRKGGRAREVKKRPSNVAPREHRSTVTSVGEDGDIKTSRLPLRPDIADGVWSINTDCQKFEPTSKTIIKVPSATRQRPTAHRQGGLAKSSRELRLRLLTSRRKNAQHWVELFTYYPL